MKEYKLTVINQFDDRCTLIIPAEDADDALTKAYKMTNYCYITVDLDDVRDKYDLN